MVSVPGEHSQVVYNVPNALIAVFPGEDHGLHSDSVTMDLLKNTFKNQQNEDSINNCYFSWADVISLR